MAVKVSVTLDDEIVAEARLTGVETEREGFEPSVDRKAHTRFPVVPVQPLRHLSEVAQSSGRTGLSLNPPMIVD